jgi:hypothetical protein
LLPSQLSDGRRFLWGCAGTFPNRGFGNLCPKVGGSCGPKGCQKRVYLTGVALAGDPNPTIYGGAAADIAAHRVLLGALPYQFSADGYVSQKLTLRQPLKDPADTVKQVAALALQELGEREVIALIQGGREPQGTAYTPQQIADQVNALEELGLEEFILYCTDYTVIGCHNNHGQINRNTECFCRIRRMVQGVFMADVKRVFLIVLDSLGIGALPDAAEYGDVGSNTLASVTRSSKLNIPNLQALGLYNIFGVEGPKVSSPAGAYGRMAQQSKGKDTTIGHWEIAGIISSQPMPTYPNGFPPEVLKALEQATGRGFLCNLPYSGTQVIADFGREHLETGKLILYTSADSVMQIAPTRNLSPWRSFTTSAAKPGRL